MKHPEIALLPLLMLSDYLLTVWGAVLKERGYNKHFKSLHYEMNPIWQESIRRKQWINPRHLLLTLLLTGSLGFLLEFRSVPDAFVEGVFGCLFVYFAMVIGRHLSNILIFRRFAHHPDEISGEVAMAHSLALAVSAYQYLVGAIPIGIIAIFNPTPFAIGGAVGTVLMLAVHWVWIRRDKNQ